MHTCEVPATTMDTLSMLGSQLSDLKIDSSHSILTVVFAHKPTLPSIITMILIFLVTVATWRRYFSPLSGLPGPFWASITRMWYIKVIIDGDQNLRMSELHEKNGHFIRMAPNEVSVVHPDAVKKILLEPMRKVSSPPPSLWHLP